MKPARRIVAHGPHSAAGRLSLLLLPWCVLFTALGLTWWVWDHERERSRQGLQAQFDFALCETVSRIEQRVLGYEQMLRGVQALFETTPLQNRQAFHDYVDNLQLGANFSGVQVIGVVERVPHGAKAAHVARMRAQGHPAYAIHPETTADFYAPIVQREPYVGRNRAALGLDVWTFAARQTALAQSRDSGIPAISGKLQLAVDAGDSVRPGFIMYLPVYAPGQPRDDVAQRNTHLAGWVYAAFRMNDFMASLYGSQSPGLSIAVYDGADPQPDALMYSSRPDGATPLPARRSALSANEYMLVAGHPWTLILSTEEEFETRFRRGALPIIAGAGIGLSVLLALLTWLMVTGRARALRLAAGMTEELRHMAQHDALTHLPNRALFGDRLNGELERAKRHDGRFAMIFLDLDHFKPINDTHGHPVGDLLLQQVARRLESSVRAVDTVGRMGGDEFVVLMAELGAADPVLNLAEKIRDALRLPFFVEGHSLQISCSMGVAVYPQDGRDALTLTKSADEAMYRAKENGRDCIELASVPH